jgi:tungstate transport system substrate-binding protein
LTLLAVALLAVACAAPPAPVQIPGKDQAAPAPRVLRLATTTSTDNSGLLKALLPTFTALTGIEVHVIAVGTGKAIRHGERGEVDVILVHARAAEERFVAEGYGVNRRAVMHNDFVLLGPAADPAKVKGGGDVAVALGVIAKHEMRFISRGDESGTHKKEQALWAKAKIGAKPAGEWYVRAGQGMGAVLTMAEQMGAYTLTDRGTWLAMQGKLSLEVLVEGDAELYNPYGVIAVNPARHAHVKYLDAMALIAWLTSPDAQTRIAAFTVPAENGERLFHPDALPLRRGGKTDSSPPNRAGHRPSPLSSAFDERRAERLR